ncbi:hypothetical protein LIP_0662 [Limnochorda pilosa]|uniref:Uncharacterized protein n=1 Tax=Limnochorda pilosa TaxID=1555112 RepID=A0A0K2SI44_LIMPI|nr:hypothetical protein LIP_0662 [Limnochorda pilosa]
MWLDPWYLWLAESRFAHLSQERLEQAITRLGGQRDRLLDLAKVRRGDRVLDVGTGTGLLAFGGRRTGGAHRRGGGGRHFPGKRGRMRQDRRRAGPRGPGAFPGG